MSKEQLPACSRRSRWFGGGNKERFAHDPVKRSVRMIFAGLILTGLLAAIRPQTASAVNLSNSVELSVSVGTNTLPARLYRPPGFDTGTNLLPLVLFLHGVGESGTDNVAQVDNRIGGLINATQGTNYASFLLAPQIPVGADFRQALWRTLIFNALQAVQTNYPIDASRLYLTGVSLGAIGIYDYLPLHPDLFAAAVPISGTGDTNKAYLFKDVPIWMFHGELDATVPVSGSRDMFAALTAAGGSPLYTEIPGAGHVIWGPIYIDDGNVLYPWMFSQKQKPKPTVTVTLVPVGATWKYLDDGSNQGTAWRGTNFNDNAWLSGPAQLGYGDGDEATTIRSNRVDNTKIITTYFRKNFVATNLWAMTNLNLKILRDDGCVVYLNGAEVFRDNMPAGTVSYTTLAPVAVAGTDESRFYTTNMNPALLIHGANLLAVEIHQQSTTSSDVSFDLELTAGAFNAPPPLSLRASVGQIVVAWPSWCAKAVVESASLLGPSPGWAPLTNTVVITPEERKVTLAPFPTGLRFFRLRLE
jgi:predicted esterase